MYDSSSNAARSLAALDMQNIALVEQLIQRQQRLEMMRSSWEAAWRDVDRRVNPTAAGGFGNSMTSGDIRGLDNFDATAIEGLDRYTAAVASVTVPRGQRWHGAVTSDKELNKLPEVARWCSHAVDRVFACRYNPLAGFEPQIYEDIRQTGGYGTAPLWTHEKPGKHLIYKSVHLSEVWIEENYCGQVDTVHRKYNMTVRQAGQEFGDYALPDRHRELLTKDGGKGADEKVEIIHVIRPNGEFRRGMFGRAGMKVESISFVPSEKWIVRHMGFRTMPMAVSRSVTSPGDVYGRSPAIKMMGTIKTLNEMAKTLLRQGQKAVDPAWALAEDLDLSVLATKPNGLNPGLLDERGEFLAKPLPQGGDIQFGLDMMGALQQQVRTANLEDFFKILTDPSDRMTATQVIEMAQKQGVLIGPHASRYEGEKLAPMFERELDLLMSAGQIDPMPEVMREAGASLKMVMENPNARMARAGEVGGFSRWVEMVAQAAGIDESVIDVVDFEDGLRRSAEVLNVWPTTVRTPEQVAARVAARQEENQQAQMLQQLPGAAGAALDLAKANQLAEVG